MDVPCVHASPHHDVQAINVRNQNSFGVLPKKSDITNCFIVDRFLFEPNLTIAAKRFKAHCLPEIFGNCMSLCRGAEYLFLQVESTASTVTKKTKPGVNFANVKVETNQA